MRTLVLGLGLCLAVTAAIPSAAGAAARNAEFIPVQGFVKPGGGYVLPGSDVRPYSYDEILSLAPQGTIAELRRFLRLARNEIFARHGYIFRDATLSAYFGTMPWYFPTSRNVRLSPVEQANVELIQMIERDYR